MNTPENIKFKQYNSASGPGGQSKNTTNNAVRAVLEPKHIPIELQSKFPKGIKTSASDQGSTLGNKKAATQKIIDALQNAKAAMIADVARNFFEDENRFKQKVKSNAGKKMKGKLKKANEKRLRSKRVQQLKKQSRKNFSDSASFNS